MSIAECLMRLRKQRGYSQKKLADLAGLEQSYISKLETGEKDKPSHETLTQLSAALGVRPGQLLGEVGAEIPLKGVVGAGPGQDDEYTNEVLLVDELFRGDVVAYRVKGNSMIGQLIRDGDNVVVRHSPEPQNGEIVVAWIDGGGAVLRRLRVKGKKRVLEASSNEKPRYNSHELTEADRIYGVYVGVIRKE